jgi:hypothetical protein
MSRGSARAVAAIAIMAVAVACDLTTKTGDVTSISSLRLPAPSVVVGDVMRDSLGVPTPAMVDAFDGEGRMIVNPHVVFSVLDSTITIDSSGFVHGVHRDTTGARVAAGVGGLQTPITRIPVTSAPATAAKTAGAAPAIAFDTRVDTSVQTNWSPLLGVTVLDASGGGAQGVIAAYSIVRSPAPLTAGVPTVFLADEGGRGTSRDTTTFAGLASRRVVLRQAAVGDADLLAGRKTDTIVVRVTASYAGKVIPGLPVDFIVPVAAKKP